MSDQLAKQTTKDYCHYTIHFPTTPSTSLPQLLAQSLAIVSTFSASYIWHNQPFNLSLSSLSFSSLPTSPQAQHLHGTTDVTDAVDDEWFIVFLLRQLSRELPQAVISVNDEDGEFLLIEAAEVLPRWVTPQNATNRVWIHQDHLHLVPIEHVSPLPFPAAAAESASFEPPEEGFLDLAAGLSLVSLSDNATEAPSDLEAIVWARIAGYPGQIKSHHHKTLAYLPTEVALALEDSPGLVAEAIAAFYEREPATLKACNTMSRFPPAAPTAAFTSSTATDSATSSELPETVYTLTTLTRPLYSQLVLQRFFPPKPFDKVSWLANSPSDADERRRNVGMKIACGFEMLYTLTSPRLRHPSADPSANPAYQAFVRALVGKGWFEGEIEGSEGWKERERKAREAWLAGQGHDDEDRDREDSSFAQRVDEAIARSRARGTAALANRVQKLPSDNDALAMEDDEDWLALDEEGFEEMLRSRGPGAGGLEHELDDSDDEDGDDESEDGMEGIEGEAAEMAEQRKAERLAKRMQEMAGKVEEFVEGRGGVDGAEFDDEQSSDDEDEEDMPTLTAEERATRLEALVAPLPVSEWGASSAPVPPTSADAPPPLATPESLPLPPRPPKLATPHYDGASDSSSDSENEAMEGEEGLGEDEGEDGPAVEEEMDMGEEMDEFLKFATETLGLTEEQYKGILGERKERGAFVPGPSKPKKTNIVPSASRSTPTTAAPAPPPAPKPTVPNPPLRNPNLTDFDALMEQMDSELAKVRASAPPAPPKATKTPKKPVFRKPAPKGGAPTTGAAPQSGTLVPGSDEEEDDDDDSEGEMDAELASLFKTLPGADADGPVDYNLVKNFLESFQSQGGFAGPAGNLAGRLGVKMPRDGGAGSGGQ